MTNTEKIVENNKHLILDLVQGDESVANREDFNNSSYQQLKQTFDIILDNPNLTSSAKSYLVNNSWKLLYKQKPAKDINEFLDEKWIGPTGLKIYPHIREDLNEFFDPTQNKRVLLANSCIGYGKSALSTLGVLYILTNFSMMRNPKKYLDVSQSSSLVGVLGSFTMNKSKQLLTAPFMNIVRSSPKFKFVKLSERIELEQEAQYNSGENKIVLSTASRINGDLEFSNDIHLLRVSDTANLLGLSILTAVLSEISFFVEKGVKQEEIWRFFTDTRERIFSRFGTEFVCKMFLDSSPNSIDQSPVDAYIQSGEAYADKNNLVITKKHWEVFPYKYDIWNKTKETFPVFKGSGSRSPKILQEHEVEDYHPDEIFNIPIDLKQKFEDNISKNLRDFASYPAGGDDKLISNPSHIENMFFDMLKNEYDAIEAPNNKSPQRLIWDKIYRKYFIEVSPNNYEFYRAPRAPRFISVDQSRNGDITSVGMFHKELDDRGEVVAICDFNIPIKAGKSKIGIEAVGEFIVDLSRIGHLPIKAVSFDQYQSESNKDKVERELNIKVTKSGADIDINVYYMLVSWLKNNKVKSGKSIFLKNNLRSLKEVVMQSGKKKVDHIQGTIINEKMEGVNWETDKRGYFAKDLSDTTAQAVFMIAQDTDIPRYQWKDKIATQSKEESKQDLYKEIQDFYCLAPRKA